ncbi:MAG TPA: formate dehydrogenase accessory sulfurtransferase FdhD [Caulobacteraceae bacterium]|nr:formate dehydrogenase accessory sulfurtransferase FdhD [Caulobacteraceae bacterium]
MSPRAALVAAPRRLWRAGAFDPGERTLPEEVPIALVHDATATAVMMATPTDLQDFAYGFSLTEGLIETPGQARGFETVESEAGIELRLWLDAPRSATLAARRRRIAGPTGCGLCGIDSLGEALRPPRRVAEGGAISAAQIAKALEQLAARQSLGVATRAVHAAGFWTAQNGVSLVREDVGRHNALDKLAGALALAGVHAAAGAVVLTSRVSIEMVQKTAAIGAPILIAVSAPTALAVRTAEEAGVTLVAVARADGFEVFTRPERVID